MERVAESLREGFGLFSELRARPGLLLRELLWRWCCGGMLLVLAGYAGWHVWTLAQPALQASGLFSVTQQSLLDDPAGALAIGSVSFGIVQAEIVHAALGIAPLALFCWVVAFAFGRSWVLRVYRDDLQSRPWALAGVEGLRLLLLAANWLLWWALLHFAGGLPVASGPGLLLYGLLALGITTAALFLAARMGRILEILPVFLLVDGTSFAAAWQAGWRVNPMFAGDIRQLRKSTNQARLLLLVAAVVATVLPAPFGSGWLLYGWWAVLSLVLLAGADSMRLARALWLIEFRVARRG